MRIAAVMHPLLQGMGGGLARCTKRLTSTAMRSGQAWADDRARNNMAATLGPASAPGAGACSGEERSATTRGRVGF
jgi:hypothetical protein